jgi:hypothetical protein
MLWASFLILVMIWALGLSTAYALDGSVHLLLIIALILFVANLFHGHRV